MTKQQTGKFGELIFVTCISIGACLASGAVSPVLAQGVPDDTWLETIIVTGSRSDEALKKTPNAITVVTQDELERIKFIDARKELLTRVPGNSLGRNLRFPLNGKNYTVNLRDGMQMRPFGSGYTSALEEVNRWDIERVEIIKGPASALYGSNAVGGVINIITKEPPLEPEYSVWSEGGSWGRIRSGFTAGGTKDNFGYTVNGNIIRDDGWRDRTAKEEKAISAKGVWQASPDTKVTIRGEYQEVFDEQPGSLSSEEFKENWRQAMVKDAFSDESYATISGSLEHQFSEMSNAKIAYSGRLSTNEGPTALSYKSGYVDEESIDHSLLTQYQRKFDYLSSKLVVGTDLQYSDNRETSYEWENHVSTEPGDLDSDWDLLALTGAPFAQLQFSPVKWAEITLGGRYDYITYTGTDKRPDDFSPRGGYENKGKLESEFQNLSKKAGVSFAVNDKTTLWLGYGEAFVAPSRSRLFTSTTKFSNWSGSWSGYNADPNLDPETAKNYSVGLRGTLAEGVFGYDLTLYHTDIKDMVVGVDRDQGDPEVDRVYVNAGEVRGQGLEASFYVKPNDMIRFDAGYTFAVNKYTDFVDAGTDYTENYLSASPLHHLNARLTVTPIANLDIELEWDHISEFYTSTANNDPNGKYQRPDLWHLKVNYEDGPWSYWGQVRNLSDVKYADSVSYSDYSDDRSYGPGEARTFMAGTRYKF